MALEKRPAQHIGLEILAGGDLDLVEGHRDVNVVEILPASNDQGFPLLSKVDEFGDTYFNQRQLEDVRSEWLRLKGKASPDQIELIDTTLGVVERVLALGPHHFLRLIGD